MDEILSTNEFITYIKYILSVLEERHGQLKLFSSRAVKSISRSVDDITKIVMYFLKNRLGMYDIKIFIEDSYLKKRHTYLSIFAKYYNYLLLNTNFSSQYLLRKDIIFGPIVGILPTLSPYLFIQIIWYSKCEDLLIESLVHVPLDLCVEILDIMIKYIDELTFSQARRIILLLIYKVYNKCLWLHLGILSEQSVMKRVHQLIMYFEILLDLLVKPKFVTSQNLSIEERYVQHGILLKNILRYIKKCMYCKIKSYSENYNLAELFTLTYGNFNERTNYYHTLPPKEVKSIIRRLDQKLATLLLNQIKHVDTFEYIVWKEITDDDNSMISLHRAIIMECHLLRELMKQNNFLVTNKQLFLCLERLIGPRKSEECILTLQELCYDIDKGKLHGMKELIKRYEEWDLSTLNFVKQRIKLLNLNDVYVILEYLYHKFAYLHTKSEKYQIYVSVLKILIQVKEQDMHTVILKYMMRHFDDNRLEYLYDEKSFDAFIQRNLFVERFNDSQSMINAIAQRCRALLIFILLNPKKVLSKIIFYEMNVEDSDTILFRHNTFAIFIQDYFRLRNDQYTVMTYLLKHIVLQQRIALRKNFKTFINKALDYQLMTADDVINELYIPYLVNSYFGQIGTRTVLLHVQSILKKNLYTYKADLVMLIIILLKKASLLRRSVIFSKFAMYKGMKLINNIIENICKSNEWTRQHYDTLCLVSYYLEPLDMGKVQPQMNALDMIQEYERRCAIVHRKLRTNPLCHPKLRNYLQSFSLDREAFIRHIILRCFENEFVEFAYDLTFVFWYDLGCSDQTMAYENVMRITTDATQVALMYLDAFPKNTFIMLLYAMVKFCKNVVTSMTSDKHKAICNILLRTLSSMNDIVSVTYYDKIYNLWFQRIENIDPNLEIETYLDEILKWIDNIFDKYDTTNTMPSANECICDENLYCKYHGFLIKKKIAARYKAYIFVCECLKSQYNTVAQRSERLLRKLCLEE